MFLVNLYILEHDMNNLVLFYFKHYYRLFTEDRSLTEYGESPRKIESQNRLTLAR